MIIKESVHSQLKWLTNRLSTMGPGEILSRVSDVGRHLALGALLMCLKCWAPRQLGYTDGLLKAPNPRDRFSGVGPEVQDRLIVEAVKWLEHKASFFALCDVPLGDPIEWHRDYSSGVVGPLKYSGLINYRIPALAGNVKYIWELNRLQHLVVLALAALWTGDDVYENEIKRQTLSWCAQNPFMMGLNWKSPLEAGMRLISWALVAFLTAESRQAGDFFYTHLRETIYQHQYFIRRFYSKHSSANNHLVGEMAGLYIGSIVWPWYQESARWRSFARRKLIAEILRQVEIDGICKERATEYQLFVLEFFVLAGALGHTIGDPFPPQYWQRLQCMLRFLSAIVDHQWNLPIFGDGDSAQVVRLPEAIQERARSLVHLAQPVSCPPDGYPPDLRSLLLLWGQTPGELPLSSVPKRVEGLQAFPVGGYYVLAADRGRDNEIVLGFDAGPLGLPPLYAHGHADALSFWLSYGGHEFLVDPGTFCYYTDDTWRSYFRSTAAHNTARIDGLDQSVAGGRFLWCRAASCRVLHVEENNEFAKVTAFHDGYKRLADPVTHGRSIRLLKKLHTVVIGDHIECRRNHRIELFYHFSEKCRVRQVGQNLFTAVNEKRLNICLDARLKPELLYGSDCPRAGWVSPTFGIRKPAFTLVATADIREPTELLTKITADE